MATTPLRRVSQPGVLGFADEAEAGAEAGNSTRECGSVFSSCPAAVG
jgi:hypothetical protein